MHAPSVPSIRLPPVRLATRRLGRARVLLGRKPALAAELDALRNAAAGALSRSALRRDPAHRSPPWRTHRRSPVAPSGTARSSAQLRLKGPGRRCSWRWTLDSSPRSPRGADRRRWPGRPGFLAATRFERALLGELLLGLLAALREVGSAEARWRPRLLEVGSARADAERRLGAGRSLLVELGVEGAAVRGRAALHLPELALRAVALDVTEPRPLPGPATARVRIAFSPRIRCGSAVGARPRGARRRCGGASGGPARRRPRARASLARPARRRPPRDARARWTPA